MAGGIECTCVPVAEGHGLTVLQRHELVLRHGPHLAPEPIHVVAVDALGAGKEALRIRQVGNANVVRVNGGAVLREVPRRPGVIEVNVGQHDLRDVRRCKAAVGKPGLQRGKRGARSRLHERHAVRVGKEVRRDDLGTILEVEVERVETIHESSPM